MLLQTIGTEKVAHTMGHSADVDSTVGQNDVQVTDDNAKEVLILRSQSPMRSRPNL